MPSAASISVRDTIRILDGPFLPMALGISENRYALWLGSGISFNRVPGLKFVVKNVLDFLQQRVVHGDKDCRFRRGLTAILELTGPSADESARTNLEEPTSTWPDLDAFAQRLVNNYARMLDVSIDGEPQDYLLWAGVDVSATYAKPGTTPDAEHLCIALLAIEGAISEMASANWDGLIEKATSELNAGIHLSVLVRPEDLREVTAGPKLYKFHGCAIKARDDAPNYRPKLVARQSQINGWATKQENVVMAERLVDIATTKRTLMVGLSAQDSNVQGLFAQAQTRMPWPWPSPNLAYVFSEDALGIDQRGLLQNVYRTAYTEITRDKIYEEALLQAYAKPLLVALVLHVLCAKLSALALGAPGNISPAARVEIGNGIAELRNLASDSVEASGHEPFVRELIAQCERALTLFRSGTVPPANSTSYTPISKDAVSSTVADAIIAGSGIREMGVGVGIVGIGVRDGVWKIVAADRSNGKSGSIGVETTVGTVNLFFASNANIALRFFTNGHIAENDNTVIVHSMEMHAPKTRAPKRALGRTGKAGVREISICELLTAAVDEKELLKLFREGAVI